MSQRDAYLQKLNGRMKEWEAQIAQLEARAAQVGADVRIQYEKQIDTLKRQQEDAQQQYERFERLGEARWQEFKEEIEENWRNFETTMKDALTRF